MWAAPSHDIRSILKPVHELSICRSISKIVEAHAAGRTVQRVRLDVGHLRQVVPESLRYCWDIVVRDTALDGVPLEITHIPAVIACRSCGALTTVSVPVFRCGSCECVETDVVSGDELLVTSLDLADASVQ